MNNEQTATALDVIIFLLSAHEELPETVRIWCMQELSQIKDCLR